MRFTRIRSCKLCHKKWMRMLRALCALGGKYALECREEEEEEWRRWTHFDSMTQHRAIFARLFHYWRHRRHRRVPCACHVGRSGPKKIKMNLACESRTTFINRQPQMMRAALFSHCSSICFDMFDANFFFFPLREFYQFCALASASRMCRGA